MLPETAVIIRTKNEERWIGECLRRLYGQTYKYFEVIIVDSGSTDWTLKIARQFPVKIFEIPPKKFSYPYALNCGIARSVAAKYIVILSAHSIPVSQTWLADGISNFSKYPDAAGVFSFPVALPDASFWDKLFQNWRVYLKFLMPLARIFSRRFQAVFRKPVMGILGFTNAIIRKDLWEKHNFDEAYDAGGEDGEFAGYWMRRGYVVIRDERFTVMHSHYLGILGWWRQWRYWKSLDRPRPFRPLIFR